MTRTSGLSTVELAAATAIFGAVLLAGGGVVRTVGDISADATISDTANRRAAEALDAVSRDLRRASLATVQRPDGSAFVDGTTDVGLSFRPVVGYSGVPVLGDRTEVRLVLEPGALAGDLVLLEGALTVTLAREISAFSISRSGDRFLLSTSSRAGPADDRQRACTAAVAVAPRNP